MVIHILLNNQKPLIIMTIHVQFAGQATVNDCMLYIFRVILKVTKLIELSKLLILHLQPLSHVLFEIIFRYLNIRYHTGQQI